MAASEAAVEAAAEAIQEHGGDAVAARQWLVVQAATLVEGSTYPAAVSRDWKPRARVLTEAALVVSPTPVGAILGSLMVYLAVSAP